MTTKLFRSKADAEAFVAEANGMWNDGSMVDEVGNGIWSGRKVVHKYNKDYVEPIDIML